MNQITLYYREGSSDKVYQASLEPKGGQFVVNFAYGRRGSTLQTGTKTPNPVDHATASKMFAKLVNEKKAKGYTPAENGTPYHHTDQANQVSGIQPQLLNPIDEDEACHLVADPDWCMQEKKDGRRLLLRKQGNAITGINRNGLIVGLPATILQSAEEIAGDWLLDGECVGDVLHAFDLLSVSEHVLLTSPYQRRLLSLIELLESDAAPQIKLVSTALDAAEKTKLLSKLRREQKEGVVFKRLDAPYTPGRPNRGGTQLKYKFCATASLIVARINEQRSVSVRLVDQDQSAGNVTIPVNHPIPEVGTVVEVRYLYAFKSSGCLFQPVYLGQRDDIDPSQCTVSQLKYRAEDSEEDGQ